MKSVPYQVNILSLGLLLNGRLIKEKRKKKKEKIEA
jgi:hypothetical protein